ncbi:aldehyde dehydrogenase family protein [Arthrobacter koreensis]|uniref:aldehyde dehydrogenase family protein n=1 Tax=Arthrobacter koreensis TaxID=199136 RepID=UPI0036DDBF57
MTAANPAASGWIPAKQFIAGEWRQGRSEKTLPDINPFTGEELLGLQLASIEDLNDAYDSARDAQTEWAAAPPAERRRVLERAAEILDERRDEIAAWLAAESGSTVVKANIEIDSAIGITREAASYPHRVHGQILDSDIPGKEDRVYRDPLGVVGVISPWNFPLHLSQRSVAPALALGNAVVLKPASDTPVTGGLLIGKVFEDAGLPAGVLSVVAGAGSEIGDAFVEHPVPSLISFTGSTAVGRNVGALAASGEHLKHTALELGGNGPFVVLADADVDQAVRAAVMGKFLHQGQICMAINRIIVEDAVHDEFVEKFTQHVRSLPAGDPTDPKTVIGPIINAKQLEGLEEKISTAKDEGAKAVLQGSTDGQVLSPWVFTGVTPEMELAREEIFGPLAGIQRARDAEHALELANTTPQGLSGAVFTESAEAGLKFARRLQVGMAHVNDMPVHDEPHVAFGGVKNSGLGRFNGSWAIDEFTKDQTLTLQHEPRQYPF